MVYGMSSDPKKQIQNGLPTLGSISGINKPVYGSDFGGLKMKEKVPMTPIQTTPVKPNINIQTPQVGGGSMVQAPATPVPIKSFKMGSMEIGKNITTQEANKQREQYQSFDDKRKSQPQEVEQVRYDPLKKAVEQIKTKVPLDRLEGMSDEAILKKAYDEMPNFKAKFEEKLATTPYQLNKTKEGYNFILKGKDEIEKLKSEGVLKDEHKADIEQKSVWDDLKIDNSKIQDNMDRLTAKMSLNPSNIYASGTTREDKIDMIKDQVEYFGNFILNAPAQFWNTMTDIIPGIKELSKSLVKDPKLTATAVVNNVKELVDNPDRIPDMIAKDPINAILLVEGITQIPRLANSVSKLPQNTQNFISKSQTFLNDMKAGTKVVADDVVNAWKEAKIAKQAIQTAEETAKAERISYKGPTEVNLTPEISKKIQKSIKPTVVEKKGSDVLKKFEQDVVKGIDTILEYGDEIKYADELGEMTVTKTPETLREFSQDITQAKNKIFQEYDTLAKQAGQGGAQVRTDGAIGELEILKTRLEKMPGQKGAVRYIEEVIDDLRGKDILDVDIAQDTVKYYNSKLESFYKNPTYNDMDKATIDALVNNNIRKAMEDVIEGAVGSNEYSTLRDKYRALKNIEKEVNKRAIVSERGNARGLVDFTDIVSADQAVRGIIGIAGGDVVGGLKSIAGGATMNRVKNYIKNMNSPDKNLRDLIEMIKNNRETILTPKKTNNGNIMNNLSDSVSVTNKKNIQGSEEVLGGGLKPKSPAPYSLKGEPITPEYKPNFKEYEAPKGLPLKINKLEPKKTIAPLPKKVEPLPNKNNPLVKNKIESKAKVSESVAKVEGLENIKGVKKEIIKPAGGKLEIEDYSIGEGLYNKQQLRIQRFSDGTTTYSVNYGNSNWQQMSKAEAISEFKKIAEKELGLQNKTMKESIPQNKVMIKAPEEPLIAEARKYKSADEFVNSKEKVYHGTNAKFDEFDISKIGSQTDEGIWGRGIYFSPNKEMAKIAPGGNGAKYIKEVVVDKSKLFDIAKYKDIQKLADDLDMWEGNFTMGSDGIIRPNQTQIRQLTTHIQDLGYDGVYVNRGGKGDELVIFDPKNIKTESQLKQIREEATNKGLKPKK